MLETVTWGFLKSSELDNYYFFCRKSHSCSFAKTDAACFHWETEISNLVVFTKSPSAYYPRRVLFEYIHSCKKNMLLTSTLIWAFKARTKSNRAPDYITLREKKLRQVQMWICGPIKTSTNHCLIWIQLSSVTLHWIHNLI